MPGLGPFRRVPWLLLVDAAWRARRHWNAKLSERERERLSALIRQTRGRPNALSARERDEVRKLVAKLELAALGREIGAGMVPGGGTLRKRRR